MVITDTPDNTKKRKKDGLDSTDNINTRGGDVCRTEASPSKISKLVHQLGSHSLGTPGSPSDPSSESSQDSDSDDSQELSVNSLKNAVSEDRHEGSLQSSVLITSSLQQAPIMDVLVEGRGVLNLDKKHVFTRLLDFFSQENLPEKIKYNGNGYNLTVAYDEFWKTFFKLSYYSKGHKIKIPQKGLTDLELKSVVKILKRGWEDERYWPKKLAQPFLESCLFGKLYTNSNTIKPKMFLKFIEPEEKDLIQDKNNVDQNVLNVFKKYCSENTVSIGDDIEESCKKAAYELMVVNMKPVIDLWSQELTGLMPKSTFDYLMNKIPGYFEHDFWKPKEDDMEGCEAPHKLWKTFFLGWSKDKVEYYFQMLANSRFDSECNICGNSWFNAKHFLCKCDKFLDTLFLDRHDAILIKLKSQLDLALERRGPYFSKGHNWEVLISYRNVPYNWPAEMNILESMFPKKYPHILVYSVSPKKRALIIEYSISWEFWMDRQKERKTRYYWVVKELLEKIGFDVEYRVFVLGSRGVLVPDLYDLFEQIFGMKHSEISKALEEISAETLSIPYESEYYKELMEVLE